MKPKSLFKSLLLAALFFMITSAGYSQKLNQGPQDLSFFSGVDETDQPYAIYIPKNFDESRKYPLVVFLHGAWSNHRLGLRRVFGQGNIQGTNFGKPGYVVNETDLEATRYFPVLKDVDYIVAAPYARGTAGYQGIPEQDVYDMLDDIKTRFKIDENRIYLTGLSMGGGGTIWLGLTRPDIWAAIAPVCPAPPAETAELSGNALNLPVHLFIGDKDFLYKTAQEWKSRFEAATPRFSYIEYPGINHNSWEYAYKDGFIFDWFSQFTRDPFPSRVNFSTEWFRYNKAYWVNLDNFTPGSLASIDAKFTNPNEIEITTGGLDAFTINLNGHPQFSGDRKLNVKVDGKSFSLRGSDAFSFLKSSGSWTNKKFTPGLTSKQAGAEGPLYTAFSGNHVYVYGTGGDPSQEALNARRAVAASAADWSGMGGRIMVFPRAISDKDVRQSDYDHSNLVLFGDASTNAIIGKYSDRLPLSLKDSSGEYGLAYIYPLNRKYVVISSGLPWWTPPKKASQQGLAFMGSKIESLKNLPDFVLFKGSYDNVIVKGSFDNNWNLTEDSRNLLKQTGVIEMK